jgi:hypothetical protein
MVGTSWKLCGPITLLLLLAATCRNLAQAKIPYAMPASYLDVMYRPNEPRPGINSSLELGRQLLQSNPRLSKPYHVCISNWVPMVHCSPDTPQELYKGKQSLPLHAERSQAHHQHPSVAPIIISQPL